MNYEDYQEITNSLKDEFPNKYTDAGFFRLWDAAKYVKRQELVSAINNLLDSSTNAPSVGAIKSRLFPAVQRARQDELREEERKVVAGGERCPLCKSTGTVLAYKKGVVSEQSYAFRCSCKMGLTKNYNYPLWENPDNQAKFEIRFPTHTNVGSKKVIEEALQIARSGMMMISRKRI